MESPLTPEQIEMLNTPLRPDEIEHKQGMSYLKGQLAVVKANQIFGIGNWSYKQIGTIEITESATKNSKDNSIYLVSVMVELTVRGCETFVEQGDCEAQGMGASSLSMARKGAVTDGLKRCLKNFGPAFGLDLYFNTAPSPAAFQSRPTQATRPATTQNSPTPSARPAQAPAAPQQPAKPSQPVTLPTTMGTAGEMLATEQQRIAIINMAGRKGVDNIELEDQLRKLYGSNINSLTRNDAAHFIKVFQEQA